MTAYGELGPFEGLVYTTARMFAAGANMECEDMRQELRVAVWQAIGKHDPSKMPLNRFVFALVSNRASTLRRGAMRRTNREGRPCDGDVVGRADARTYVTRDEVYGKIDGGLLTLPATVTQREADVLVMLMMEMGKMEIARRLEVGRREVDTLTEALRIKFADWRPLQGDASRIVALAA
jgi:hypothetical protein